MRKNTVCCRVRSPRERRPVRAAYQPRPRTWGDLVNGEYLAGRMTLAQARRALPDFIPEYALVTDLDEVLALLTAEDGGPPPAPLPDA